MTAVVLIVVELTYAQDETQEEFDLCTKTAQEEHVNATGEPRPVVWMPKGRAQVALHWFMVVLMK